MEGVAADPGYLGHLAGMGGNAGTQALAGTMRRLARGLILVNVFTRVVGKEILVGITNAS